MASSPSSARTFCESGGPPVKVKSKLNKNQIKSYALASQDSLCYKAQTVYYGTFRQLVARENARFQIFATRVTGARDSARQALAICRIHCACTSDQPSRAMQNLSVCRIACASVSAAAAMSAQLRRTNPYTSSNSRSPASVGHTGSNARLL